MSKDSPEAELLKGRYPRLFRDDQPRGIECGSGWFFLLSNLFIVLEQELNFVPLELQNDMYVALIKEKFGVLDIHMNQATPFMRGAIAMAEQSSFTICEDCGAPGVRRPQLGWIKTLCDQHYGERIQL